MFSTIDARTGLGVALALWAMGSGAALAAVPPPQDLPEVLKSGSTAHELKALRGAMHGLEGPQKDQLEALIQDHHRGALAGEELSRRALELDPEVLAAVDGAVLEAPRVADDVVLAGSRFEGGLAGVDRTLLGSFQARVTATSDDSVYLDLTPYLQEGATGKVRWLQQGLRLEGQPVRDLDTRRGFELEVGETAVLRGDSTVELGPRPQRLCTVMTAVHGEGGAELEVLDVFGTLVDVPMDWSEEAGGYVAEYRLGLFDPEPERAGPRAGRRPDRPRGVRDLDTPRTVTVGGQGSGVSADPRELTFTKVGELTSAARLRAEQHDVVEVALRVLLGKEEFVLPAVVEPRTAALVVRPGADEIWGFGLGRTTLTFTRLAEDGRELAAEDPLPLTLQQTEGAAHIGAATIPAGRASSEPVDLRSVSVGPLSLLVHGDSISVEADRVLTQVWPWELILACLLAGALGAAVRLVPRAEAGDGDPGDVGVGAAATAAPARPGATRWAVALPVGALVGLVLVMALLTGLVQLDQVPAAQVTTLAGAFVVALVGGYLGRKVLDRMAKAA